MLITSLICFALLMQGMHLPPSLVMGEGNVQGSLKGSLLAPEVTASWQLPDASASGTASIAREVTKVTCRAPTFDISTALHVVPPDFEAVKNATTQAEISALAVPVSLLHSRITLCCDSDLSGRLQIQLCLDISGI